MHVFDQTVMYRQTDIHQRMDGVQWYGYFGINHVLASSGLKGVCFVVSCDRGLGRVNLVKGSIFMLRGLFNTVKWCSFLFGA